MENIRKITEFLGEKNEKKLRDSLTDFLIDYFRDDLSNMNVYLIDFEEMFAEIREELKNEIKEKVARKYIDIVSKKVEETVKDMF